MNFVNTCYGLCIIVLLTTVTGLRRSLTINGRTPEECSATEWYYCFLSPCYFKSCSRYPSAECSVQTTRCGGCRAVWSLHGQEVNCDAPIRCPLGMREMNCPNTLCAEPFCPDYPEAICWPDTCGQCGEIYLLDGFKVDCFKSIRHRIRLLRPLQTNSRSVNPTSSNVNRPINDRAGVVAGGNIPPSPEQPSQTVVFVNRPSASLGERISGTQPSNGQVTLGIPAQSSLSSNNVAPSENLQLSSGFSGGINNDPTISSPSVIPRLNLPRLSTPLNNPSESNSANELSSSNKLPSISSNPHVPNTSNVQSEISSNVNTTQVSITSNSPSQTALNVDPQNTESALATNMNSDPFAFADTNSGLLSPNNADTHDPFAMFELNLGDTGLLDSPMPSTGSTFNATTDLLSQTATDVNSNPSTDPFSNLEISGVQNMPIDKSNTQPSNPDPLSNQPVQVADQLGGNVPLPSATSQSSIPSANSQSNQPASTIVVNPIQGTQTSTDVNADPFISNNADAADPFALFDLSNIDLPPANALGSTQINQSPADSSVPGVDGNTMKATTSPSSQNNQPQPINVKMDQNLNKINPPNLMEPTTLVGAKLIPAASQSNQPDPVVASPRNPAVVASQRRQPDPSNRANFTVSRARIENGPTASELGTISETSGSLIPPQNNQPSTVGNGSTSGDSQIPIGMVAPRIPGAVEVIQSNVQSTGIVKPCLPGTAVTTCTENPCTNQTCHIPGAVCHESGCGSCHAEWHVDRRKVDCSPPCPRDTIETVCRDPCTFLGCPAYPHAICRMSKCSACTANYYVHNEKVNCDLVTETCPPGKEPRGCTCPIKICPYNLQVRCRVVGCGSNCKFEFYKMTPQGGPETVECGWFSRKRG